MFHQKLARATDESSSNRPFITEIQSALSPQAIFPQPAEWRDILRTLQSGSALPVVARAPSGRPASLARLPENPAFAGRLRIIRAERQRPPATFTRPAARPNIAGLRVLEKNRRHILPTTKRAFGPFSWWYRRFALAPSGSAETARTTGRGMSRCSPAVSCKFSKTGSAAGWFGEIKGRIRSSQ